MTSKTHRFARCHRHPTKPVTGFCASCLRERLVGIDPSSDDLPPPPPPELRRTKSCSGTDPPAAAVPEPRRRRSCEVLAPAPRNTLSDLFNLDDDDKKKLPNGNLDADSGLEITEAERENNGNGAIRACGDGFFAEEEDDEETKTMKEFIDLELRRRKNNPGRDYFIDIAGGLCKRLRKWRLKQKSKKNRAAVAGGGCCGGDGNGGAGKNRMIGLRETQSEVGEYGILGRRSCDTDPRLSVDAGRMSVDDSRLSFEAARASWDGYLIGKASCHRFSPMVHVNGVRVLEEEQEEEEEEVNLGIGGENFPGGSSQTKDYYSDSLNSQRRRRSFDRSSSSRRKPSMADVDELRVLSSNAKVSPATSELFYGAKVLITEKDLRDENSKSKSKPLVDVQSGFVMGSGSKDDGCGDVANVANQKGLKKLHKFVKLWNKFGLVQRRREDKMVDEECGAGDAVNKPVAAATESWQRLRRAVNGHASSESVSQKLIRSYSVSCRNPCRMPGLANGFGGHETNGSVLNGRQEFTLQRNRSVSYSPSNVDTGLLRFYLTPLKSYRRSRSGKSSIKD